MSDEPNPVVTLTWHWAGFCKSGLRDCGARSVLRKTPFVLLCETISSGMRNPRISGNIRRVYIGPNTLPWGPADCNFEFIVSSCALVIFAMLSRYFLCCALAASVALAAPASSSSESLVSSPAASSSSAVSSVPASAVSSAPSEAQTVAPASDDPNNQVYPQGTDETPEAINGDLGASIIFPDNTELDQQNPDFLAPPSTDHGSTYVTTQFRGSDLTNIFLLEEMQSGRLV